LCEFKHIPQDIYFPPVWKGGYWTIRSHLIGHCKRFPVTQFWEESPYKPDSVVDNHPSGAVIANYLGATYPWTQRAAS
jgi:hypothetical protein